MTTTIQKWGNSQGIRIPKPLLESMNFFENDEVELTAKKEGILIRKTFTQKQHKPLKQRLEEFYGKNIETILQEHANDYNPSEIDWGEPVGNEIW